MLNSQWENAHKQVLSFTWKCQWCVFSRIQNNSQSQFDWAKETENEREKESEWERLYINDALERGNNVLMTPIAQFTSKSKNPKLLWLVIRMKWIPQVRIQIELQRQKKIEKEKWSLKRWCCKSVTSIEWKSIENERKKKGGRKAICWMLDANQFTNKFRCAKQKIQEIT